MDHLNHDSDREAPIRTLLTRAIQRARGSLFWERLWPALATLATAFGLFLAFSWAGLWTVLPPLGRAAGLVLFGLLILAACVPLLRLRLPSLHDGLRRLDRTSGELHRPASAVSDTIAANRADPVAQALWRAHVERALMSARKFRAGWPQPRLSLRDPIALRALVLILVVASFFAASGERGKRIMAAGKLDVGGIEYLESRNGLMFYDINANSNLRPSIAQAFGFDPFERVVDFLLEEMGRSARLTARSAFA